MYPLVLKNKTCAGAKKKGVNSSLGVLISETFSGAEVFPSADIFERQISKPPLPPGLLLAKNKTSEFKTESKPTVGCVDV